MAERYAISFSMNLFENEAFEFFPVSFFFVPIDIDIVIVNCFASPKRSRCVFDLDVQKLNQLMIC
jgi:hypothetical protein